MMSLPIESLPAKNRKEVEAFLRDHPRTPAGRLRPRMGLDGQRWFALLGRNFEDGKVAFGETPVTALREFNRSFSRTNSDAATA
jgi:hypothetical protein